MRIGRFDRLILVACLAIVAFFVPEAGFGFIAFAGETTTYTSGATGSINEAMKIIFNDPVAYNVVSDSELLDIFEKDTNVQVEETTGGRYIETAQYLQLPAGVGGRLEGDYIPVPGAPSIKNSRVYLKKLQGVVEMSGDVMRRVRTNKGAFLNWAERALPDLVTRLDNEIDRMLIGWGGGVKAMVNDASTDATLQIDNAFGVAGLEDAYLQFLEGESIVFGTTITGATLRDSGTSAKVTKVTQSSTAAILTLDALPTGVVDNDYIFLGDDSQGGQPESGEDREIMGLIGMINDENGVLSTFQNLARATYTLWNSVVIDGDDATLGFDGTLTEDMLVYADDETFVKGGGRPDCIVGSRSAARSYWKSLKGDRQINDPRKYTGGKMKGVGIMLSDREVTLKVARKMPPQLVFGIQTDTCKRWTLGGWEWDDNTGSIWNRVTDGTGRKDSYYAVGNLYKQTGNLLPRKNFQIKDLTRVA